MDGRMDKWIKGKDKWMDEMLFGVTALLGTLIIVSVPRTRTF